MFICMPSCPEALATRHNVKANGTSESRTLVTDLFASIRLTISILNRVARRTKQSSQANAAVGTSVEPRKDLMRSALSFLAEREAGRATQTEDIYRTLRGPPSSNAHGQRPIRS